MRRINRLIQLDDILMVQLAQNADLPYRLLLPLSLLQLRAVVLLNSDALSARPMNALLDHCVGTVADLLAEVVDVEIGAVGRSEVLSYQQVRGAEAVVGRASELVITHGVVVLVLGVIARRSVVEEGESAMLLLVLRQQLLVPECLPILFELARK